MNAEVCSGGEGGTPTADAVRPRQGRGPIVARVVGWMAAFPLVACGLGLREASANDRPGVPVSAPLGQGAGATAAPLPPAPEATTAPVLDLHGDGFSVGSLLDAAPAAGGPLTALRWKSPLFATPLELPIPEVVRIRFPRRGEAAAAAPGSWRFELRGGDVILGTIEQVDGERFLVRSHGIGAAGPLSIRRDFLERMTRLEAATRTIVPGGLDGWDAVRGAWQERGGALSCDRPIAAAFRDVAAPARACYDVALSWTTRPDFDLYVATDAEQFAWLKAPAPVRKPNDVDEYRLQARGGKLQAWREGAKADFGEIAPLAGGAGRLRVHVFVDQEAGRMAVVMPKDGQPAEPPVFDKTIAPRKAVTRSGFSLRLRTGTIRIDGLRVLPWDGGAPRLEPAIGLGSPAAVIESFDKTAGEFVVRDGAETRRIAAATAEIAFPSDPGAAAVPHGPAAVTIGFSAGSRLTGSVRDIAMGMVTLDCVGLDGPLAFPLDRILLLESVQHRQPSPLPGRVGMLEADTARMLGCVGQADGVGWQPWGAVAPARFAPAASAKISYRGTPLLGGPGVTVAKQGQAWAVTDVAPGGPAARDGRIQRGWTVQTIQLLPAGQPIAVGGLKAEEMDALLRGIIGSSIGLRFKDQAGKEHEVALLRDRAGRGDLAGSTELGLLDTVLRTHDEKLGIKPGGGGAGGSLITLKTGDAIFCRVLSADADGLRVETGQGNETVVPNALVRAAEFINASAVIVSAHKKERLTTLPRMHMADPPTHLIRLDSGDYLRGKLLTVDEKKVTFRVLEETKEFDRQMVLRIIWLSVAGDGADQKALELLAGGKGLLMQSLTVDKRRLTVAAERYEDGRVIGTAGPLGRLPIDLGVCESLAIGAAIAAQPAMKNDFKQWELKPAKLPRALQKN